MTIKYSKLSGSERTASEPDNNRSFLSLLNTDMKKTYSALTLANLELDRQLLNSLLELHIIQNQSELGRMCGKTESYYTCMRYKGFGLKIGSLAFLCNRLSRMAQAEPDGLKCINYRMAIEEIRRTIDEKCRLRELELISA
jgi:hypothetical protein